MCCEGRTYGMMMSLRNFGMCCEGRTYGMTMSLSNFGMCCEGRTYGMTMSLRNFGMCCEGRTYGMMMSLRNFGMGLASISTRTWNDNIVIHVSPSSPQVSMYCSPRPNTPDWNVLYTQPTTLSRISHDQQFIYTSATVRTAF